MAVSVPTYGGPGGEAALRILVRGLQGRDAGGKALAAVEQGR